MIKWILRCIIIFTVSSCSNVFEDVASSDPDTLLLIEAKDAINALNYSGAITILTTQVSASSQAKLEFKEALASAYAGQCGLNFASFVNGLASATSGSAFRLVMNPFVGVVVDSPSCLQSLNLMETIGTTESRTTNQNAFVSVVGMVLMGSQTRVSSDVTPTNGDGTIDADVCAMSNDDIDRVILGFGFMSKNFSALSTAQLGSTSQTSITDSITQCSAVAGSTCEIIDPAEITDPLRDVMRDLLNTIEYGVGSVVTNGDPLLIPGACP